MRSRPGLRLVLALTLVGAGVGASYGLLGRGSPGIGAAVGALNSGTLSFLEIFVLGRWARAALARWPFAAYFTARVALYVAVVLAANLSTLALAGVSRPLSGLDSRDIWFALAICAAVNLLFSVNDLLGPGVLFAFAAGRYRRPRREERVLLYLDLRGSTALVERLGEERFLDLLNEFFAEVTAEIVGEGGEIHKYVGDEVIAVWPAAADPARPIRACFAAAARIEEEASAYRRAFGAVPSFRAAIHAGPVVIGELGARKKEIALIGDAMNTAAHILEAAREAGASVLVSSMLYDRLGAPLPGVDAKRLPPIVLRGKSAPLSLISLTAKGVRLSAGNGPI